MEKKSKSLILRTLIGFVAAAFLVVSFGGASIVGPLPVLTGKPLVPSVKATDTMRELARLDLLKDLPEEVVQELLTHQVKNKQSLAQILRDPVWTSKLGLNAGSYKATWYAANPFDLLPKDLQQAIAKTPVPFQTTKQIKLWCKKQNAPERWERALKLALIETTPINLWRASRGLRPYAKNGQYLEPIVVEKAVGQFDVRDGHIATDPRVIPTNTKMLLVVLINGEERIIRVKAADIGGAIRGRHVDLPISIRSKSVINHSIRFPGEYIRNPTVLILSRSKKINPGRKA